MKIQTGHIHHHRGLHNPVESRVVPAMVDGFRETLALLGAVSAAITIVMISVWMTGSQLHSIYSALTWGAGFVFLAMAVDSRVSMAVLQALTGLALLILAWLQNAVSVDLSIVAGIVVALWVAAMLFRRLK